MDTSRARRLRQFLAAAFNVAVWGGVAAAAWGQRKAANSQLSWRRHGAQTFAAQQERWSTAYPTAEDFSDDETPLYGEDFQNPAPQYDHQPHG